MSDLIDLDSPDPRKLVSCKLASPLIPVPVTNDHNEQGTFPNDLFSLNVEKRSSLDNNPFDMVLQELTEYARKKEDPFEIVLEKALKSKNQSTTLRACIEFKDDFRPKRKRHADILKMNKTLDDSLTNVELSTGSCNTNFPVIAVSDNVNRKLDNTSYIDDNCKNFEEHPYNLRKSHRAPLIEICPSSPVNLSILNQSAMNDSLSETSSSFEEQEIKCLIAQRVSMCIEKGALDAKCSTNENEGVKSFKLRRSLSQDNNVTKKLKPFRQRSQSIIETLKANMGNKENNSMSSMSSLSIDNPMNKDFILSRNSKNSDISNTTNISSITRLSSASSTYNYSSSVFSDGTINRAFINSCSSVGSNKTNLNERSNLQSVNTRQLKSTSSIVPILQVPAQVDVSDLAQKYQQLKLRSALSYSEGFDITEKIESVTIKNVGDSNQDTESKLIDVDSFVPAVKQNNSSLNKNLPSLDSSSDSVFAEDDKIDKSILFEARALAKTFEELAERTTSGSSSIGEDLINSRPRWNFDFLPLSDDESQVENLIELPMSPERLDPTVGVNANLQIINETKLLDLNTPRKDYDIIKELETEFIDQKYSEKKIMATTLLLDLEKLIKTENNPEAIALLDNLEKALGVKCENNAELLATCLCDVNNLSKSCKNFDSKLECNDNIKHENIERSREENADVDPSEDTTELGLLKNADLDNNLNTDKEINKSVKSLIIVNDKAEDTLSEEGPMKMKESSDVIYDDLTSVEKKQDEVAYNQEVAVKLLINLSKVLNEGNSEESSTLKLLMNLGKVLNLATNQLNFEKNNQSNDQNVKNEKDISKKISNVPKSDIPKSHQSSLLKSASRRSLDSATKTNKTAEKVLRRSTLGSQTAGGSNVSNVVVKEKNEDKKRFSSNPETLKDIRIKSIVIPEIKKVKPSTVASTVRNKLRKKSDSDIVNKRGPMKAILPLGNMQRRGSLGRRVAPLLEQVTPPKSVRNAPSAFTITNNTLSSTSASSGSKKSPKIRPVASSTPESGSCKIRNGKSQLPQNFEKRNFFGNISPVPLRTNTNSERNILKNTSNIQRHNKTLSPPKGQKSKVHQAYNRTESSSFKYSPQISCQRRNSFGEAIKSQSCSNSPKVTSLKSQLPQLSPLHQKKSGNRTPQSPLKNSNKQTTKLKPFNLISKLRRRSSDSSIIEKENRI